SEPLHLCFPTNDQVHFSLFWCIRRRPEKGRTLPAAAECVPRENLPFHLVLVCLSNALEFSARSDSHLYGAGHQDASLHTKVSLQVLLAKAPASDLPKGQSRGLFCLLPVG